MLLVHGTETKLYEQQESLLCDLDLQVELVIEAELLCRHHVLLLTPLSERV